MRARHLEMFWRPVTTDAESGSFMENAVNQAEQGEQPVTESQEPQARKPQPPHDGHRARIVVVGGGVAGLEVATALGKLKSESIDTVTLVDPLLCVLYFHLQCKYIFYYGGVGVKSHPEQCPCYFPTQHSGSF